MVGASSGMSPARKFESSLSSSAARSVLMHIWLSPGAAGHRAIEGRSSTWKQGAPRGWWRCRHRGEHCMDAQAYTVLHHLPRKAAAIVHCLPAPSSPQPTSASGNPWPPTRLSDVRSGAVVDVIREAAGGWVLGDLQLREGIARGATVGMCR